jgi:hypothetical protein
MEMNSFFEHLGLIAAFGLATYVSSADGRPVSEHTHKQEIRDHA